MTKQYTFGSGVLAAVPANGVDPIAFGALQDVSMEFTGRFYNDPDGLPPYSVDTGSSSRTFHSDDALVSTSLVEVTTRRRCGDSTL